MNLQQLTQVYENAVALAEAGQYEPALSRMFDYLRHRPRDGQALNDAATILFCLGRGQEAIACYEKAVEVCTGDALAQVHWNLCEAYLQEGMVGRAVGLFDTMQSLGLLNVDVLNRAANAMLEQDLLGPAVELLHRSLQMNPDQEILKPMLEVIISNRARTAIIAQRDTRISQLLVEGLRHRVPLKEWDGRTASVGELLSGTDIALFVGCGRQLAEASLRSGKTRMIALLESQDILNLPTQAVNWHGVQAVILCGGSDLKELFIEQAGLLPDTLRIMTAEPIVDPERIAFTGRKRGKRIAAVGPWDARRNPMFALMCFQKLHFLDPDTRLYLAGTFTDAATERYVRAMIEALGLDNVVFLDGPIKDLKKWFKDKQYILSTAIDGAGMEDVWLAMACGLRPVVHTFPGASERLESEYLFMLAEDFCNQVLHGNYDAAGHRADAERHFMQRSLEQVINEYTFEIEKELHTSKFRQPAALQPVLPSVPASQKVQAQTPAFMSYPSGCQATVDRPSESIEMPAVKSAPVTGKSIGQIASDAIAASQKLKELSFQLQQQAGLSPSEQTSEKDKTTSGDTFKYNRTEGLSVDELMEEGRGSVPFPVRR